MSDNIDAELAENVENVLNEEVPQIRGHGGRFEVEYADPEEGLVELSLAGSCSTCVIAPMTIDAIESRLPNLLDNVTTVSVKREESDGEPTVPDKTARMEEMSEYDKYEPLSEATEHI